MDVLTCDLPKSSALHSNVKSAYFTDSYSAALRNPEASIISIFFAVFGHHPKWMKLALVLRNKAVAPFGLRSGKSSDIFNPQIKEHYMVGEKIGRWPIYHLTDNELVAGLDDKHLNFRLSIFKSTEGGGTKVIVSTVCDVHNIFGKVYLFFVVPFHKWGVRKIIQNAVIHERI
ncbi:DUF2867 domain-containing protein [Noviherbaspirillum sp.]|uniref:DUF2867 domain-containing protein n=1 Tax=Noviherbaspirillum sp. TaxID=1926288 RepID=UPI002FE114D0